MVFEDGIRLRWRRRTLIQYDLGSSKKKTRDTDSEHCAKTEGDCCKPTVNQGMPKIGSKPPGAGLVHGTVSLPNSRGSQPCPHLGLRLLGSRTERNMFLLFKSPSLWHCVMAALATTATWNVLEDNNADKQKKRWEE